MSCFFCSSNEHVTQNCDIYKSDEERREILLSKNCCQSCLCFLEKESICLLANRCENVVKCYCCYSPTHHTVFCPDRSIMPPLFPPKIDQNLISRFLELFTIEEKYSIIFLSPSIPVSKTFPPLKIKCMEEINLTYPIMLLGADLVVVDKLYSELNFGTVPDAKILLNSAMFRVKHLHLRSIQISAAQILLLLSSKTKSVKFGCLSIPSKIKFREILKNAPNLEKIDLTYYHVDFGSSWPEDILQLNCAERLQINLQLLGFEFNVKSLANFIKSKDVTAFFRICVLQDDWEDGAYGRFQKDLSKHFNQVFTKPSHEKFITISFEYDFSVNTDPECYFAPKL